MPENLFYNTTSAGIILVVNKDKKCKDEVLLINASKLFEKGRPKNFLPDKLIQEIFKLYLEWKSKDGVSLIIPKQEVIKNDFNLSPSRYVSANGDETTLPLDESIVLLKEAREEQNKADEDLKDILNKLGFEI